MFLIAITVVAVAGDIAVAAVASVLLSMLWLLLTIAIAIGWLVELSWLVGCSVGCLIHSLIYSFN